MPFTVRASARADAIDPIDAFRAAGAAPLAADRFTGVLANARTLIEIEQEIAAITLGQGAGCSGRIAV